MNDLQITYDEDGEPISARWEDFVEFMTELDDVRFEIELSVEWGDATNYWGDENYWGDYSD